MLEVCNARSFFFKVGTVSSEHAQIRATGVEKHFRETANELYLVQQHLPAPDVVRAFGVVAVLEHRVPLVALAVTAPIALLKLSRSPRGVKVVHGPHVGLCVDAGSHRLRAADSEANLAFAHQLRQILLGHLSGDLIHLSQNVVWTLCHRIKRHVGEHRDLIGTHTLRHQFFNHVAHQAEALAAEVTRA